MPAIRNPTTSTMGTASIVNVTAFGASTVERANVKASQPATMRQATVSVTIHWGDRSRSRSSVVATAREAASVFTRPMTTGLASVASV